VSDNHAIHIAAISIRHKHSDGRAYYDKKLAEGKTHKEALRALKRRISDAIYAAAAADAPPPARRAPHTAADPPHRAHGHYCPATRCVMAQGDLLLRRTS
jgi:hypothetical protein